MLLQKATEGKVYIPENHRRQNEKGHLPVAASNCLAW